MSRVISVVVFLSALATSMAGLAEPARIVHEEPTTYNTTGISTYAQAVAYGRNNPTRDGGSWNGWCAALMVRAGNLPKYCPTAIDCYYKSSVVSKDINSAPSGAFHWWNIGTAGHVAMATDNGWAMMASCHVSESWGDCIGVTSVASYTATTGAGYLGWSYDYYGQVLTGVQPGPGPTPSGLPLTTTEYDGVPGTNYYKRQQYWAAQHGYTGPIDGVLGTNSWAGTQRALQSWGYTGPIDGVPGSNTYKAMQRLAAAYGYTGSIDGELGTNSYKGVAKFLNTL